MARSPKDEWVRPTLLGMAFYAGNVREARRLLSEIRSSGHAAWQLETTVADLRVSVEHHTDGGEVGADLAAVLTELEALLEE
jgi:hypothetical protein